jgi:nucleoside-diphosphate-sugar epimerase
MPIVQPSNRILVTGATGFIATWVIHTLLKDGFWVHGTVRFEAKGKGLQAICRDFGNEFEFIVVEDVEKVGPRKHSPDHGL